MALARYQFGFLLIREGIVRRKSDVYSRAHDELAKALAIAPKFPAALFADGFALSQLKQDDTAKAQFEQYVKLAAVYDPQRQRALRYISDPELARARMAPAFAVTTIDGQRVSMDDLQGKVVLLDFWATWCAPCREALPRMQKIAKSFQGQPLVVLSVSIDTDEQKWKDFVKKNEMTWLQSRDQGFTGPIAKLFGVRRSAYLHHRCGWSAFETSASGTQLIEGRLSSWDGRRRWGGEGQ